MTREELIAAVIAAPDDDGPRLVLADWFAEQGDARGELIHVGCALADGSLEPGQREPAERRYAELIAGPATKWLAELGLKQEVAGFHRGMVESVALPWAELRLAADRLFASTPLRAITSWDFDETGVRQWAQVPWLKRLQTFHLRRVPAAQLAGLLAPGDLANVRRLIIEATDLEADPRGVKATADWPVLPLVVELSFINTGLTDATLGRLLERVGRLASLDLTVNRLGIAGLRSLLHHAESLRSLALGSNRFGDAGALLLAEASFPRLESLRLEATGISDKGVLALLGSATLPRLRTLDLSSNALTDAGAVAIAGLDRGLQSLNVTANLIGERGERALRARYGAGVRI